MHALNGSRTLAVALMLATLAPLHARQQPPIQRAPGTLNEGVTAVLVDVVVRDRRGLPVRDLTQADFQVLEDGVPQPLGSFTQIAERKAGPAAPAPVAATAKPGTAGTPEPAPRGDDGPIVTALVFDRLSPEARRLAVQAAQGYLGSKPETEIYVGLFGVDIGLTPYAPFTRNVRVLRQALDTLGKRGSAAFNSPEQQQQRANADQQAGIAAQQMAGATAAGAGASNAMGGAPGDLGLAQMASGMIRDFELMERDQQGYSTTNGLFAIINAMRRLPGRKSLVLFSEGLAIPPAVQRLFHGVIEAANRANVSIYAMDAKGLRAESEQAKIRDQVNAAGGAGGGTLGTAAGSGNDPLSKALEKNEDVLRQDPHSGLGELAQDTGGMFFANTNNLRQGLDRIEDDLRNYYLLGYTPTNSAFDGRFRSIEVKVNRPGVTVAARKGYFAVRDPGDAPVYAHEAPALAAFEQKPVPNAFPVRAGALIFPERDRPGLIPVVVELRTAPLSFPAADGINYTSDFTVLVRFLDQDKRVVRKVSQHYEVRGPIAEIERAKAGDVIFYRQAELPPGVYTMETVVHDAPSGKASVRFSTVEVPAVDPAKLRMSSLMIVKRGEKMAEQERAAENPLFINGVALTPNLGDPVSRKAKEVAVYFVVYPAAGRGPDVTVQVLQNGAVTSQLPMPVPPADRGGRIQQLARLPIEQLTPGTYELRVIATQGGEQAVRTTMLRVAE